MGTGLADALGEGEALGDDVVRTDVALRERPSHRPAVAAVSVPAAASKTLRRSSLASAMG